MPRSRLPRWFLTFIPGNKLATLVGLNKAVDVQVGKDIAMQVAAMNPVAVDKSRCSS